MKSGAYFSAIFTIWIVGLILAFYMLYPDIKSSIETINQIDTSAYSELMATGTAAEPENPVDYTPLSVFNRIGI